MLLLCMHLIFSDEKPQKRVAVIVEKSGDEKWDSFITVSYTHLTLPTNG